MRLAQSLLYNTVITGAIAAAGPGPTQSFTTVALLQRRGFDIWNPSTWSLPHIDIPGFGKPAAPKKAGSLPEQEIDENRPAYELREAPGGATVMNVCFNYQLCEGICHTMQRYNSLPNDIDDGFKVNILLHTCPHLFSCPRCGALFPSLASLDGLMFRVWNMILLM